MPAYVALRAVNVGGTGKLPMSELKAMCVAEGFGKVQTYVASGNVVFSDDRSELKVKAALENRLTSDYDREKLEQRLAALSVASPSSASAVPAGPK